MRDLMWQQLERVAQWHFAKARAAKRERKHRDYHRHIRTGNQLIRDAMSLRGQFQADTGCSLDDFRMAA